MEAMDTIGTIGIKKPEKIIIIKFFDTRGARGNKKPEKVRLNI